MRLKIYKKMIENKIIVIQLFHKVATQIIWNVQAVHLQLKKKCFKINQMMIHKNFKIKI